ncbi:MAG: serine hydrolase domain-containing protein [Gammaproteobacteria bacterium]|nr:serine hydrolase domain-containing protein [Gammaproteobacteria bacterium]
MDWSRNNSVREGVWICVAAAALAILVLGAPPALARDLPMGKPAREGLSAPRLERITEHMNQAVADGVMVGGLGLIARNGRVVYEETYGLADREAGTPMREDTIFRIYSMSKPITSVAVMMLYEQGHFFLNDPVARYLPELADLEVAVSTADGGDTRITSDGTSSRTEGEGDTNRAGETREPRRQPTIRDLLTHTAGFTYGVFGNTEVDKLYREAQLMSDDLTLETFVERLGGIPLQYEPGTRWHYSVSVDVLGRLVEVVSGMPFGEYLEKHLFAPLGMVDTGFRVPDDQWSRVAQLYTPKGTRPGPGAFLNPSTSTELEVADESVSAGYRSGRAVRKRRRWAGFHRRRLSALQPDAAQRR